MSLTRLLITAVVVENRAVREVAVQYGVSKSWVYELLARYRREGDAVFEPRSRRPKTSPTAVAGKTVDLIVELREKLTVAGFDAGPDTICWHLAHHHHLTVSRATVARYLANTGSSSPSRRSAPRPPTSGSPRSCPTSAGRPTSPTTGWPTAPTPRS
jgi:transposase